MFESWPVSRMRARHEALARDVMDIHAGGFSAVYGCREVRHGLVGKGRDPGEAGRDQVMDIMRGLGMRGVRRGKTPVTTRPAKGTGGRPDLVDRKFEAEAPDRLHVAGITYGRMADGRSAYTASVTDMFARRIVGRACATTMNTEEPPLQALEQAIAWAASHGGTDGLARHGDHGVGVPPPGPRPPHARVMEYGMLPSTGTVGDSRDNAMAESADGAYRTGLVWRRKPFHDPKDLGPATFRRVSRRGPEASAPALGPPDTGTDRNRVLRKPNGASRPTIRAEKNRPYHPLRGKLPRCHDTGRTTMAAPTSPAGSTRIDNPLS